MAPISIPKDRTINALEEVWTSIGHLLATLHADEWRAQTPLPGWDVQANVAHILGTEAFLLGIDGPPAIDPDTVEHVKNPIGALNEAWVVALAGAKPPEVLAKFREITTQRLTALRSITDEAWNAEGFTPAGNDTHGRFMRIRVFDCWMHEQDIRCATDRPGHDSGLTVEVTLDEMSGALGYVVGKKVAAPAGSSVTFELTGESGRSIHVLVDERATVVDHLDAAPTVTLTMPVLSFGRIAGGRLDAAEHIERCTIDGEQSLGRRILDNLSYTI